MRVEELVNYFDYSYAQTTSGDADPFRVEATVVRSPWNAERNLLRISLKGKDVPLAQLPAANLVFLVDVSGSMASEKRLPLVKSALKLLVDQLRPVDRVTIVTYASGTHLVLPPPPATARDRFAPRSTNSSHGEEATTKPASAWRIRRLIRASLRMASTA